MTFPVSARFLNLHPDHVKVVGTDQLGIVIDVSGDLEIGAGAGARIKPTLAGQYTFTLAPRTAAAPTNVNDLTNKAYVDALINGFAWKQAVRVRSTANIPTLGGLLTIDGVTLVNGDDVLVADQTTASANGIYTASASDWVRRADYAVGSNASGATVHVREGTVNANSVFTQVTEGVVNTAAQSWVKIPTGAMPVAGNGIVVTGNTWNVTPINTSIFADGTGIRVALQTGGALSLGGAGLQLDITGTTAETVPAAGDEILMYDISVPAIRKITRANFLSGLVQGSKKYADYTITAGNVTAKNATIVAANAVTSANVMVYVNGLLLGTADATFTGATGVLAWTSLALDGRIAAGDIVTIWGR